MKPLCNRIALSALAVTLGASFTIGSATAQSLAEQEAWENQMGYTQRSIDTVADVCKVKLAFEYDKPSWWKVRDQWGQGSPNGRCDDVLNTLERMCRNSAAAQKAIASKVKSLKCGYGGKTSGFSLRLTSGAISYNVEVDKPNVQDLIEKYLKENL